MKKVQLISIVTGYLVYVLLTLVEGVLFGEPLRGHSQNSSDLYAVIRYFVVLFPIVIGLFFCLKRVASVWLYVVVPMMILFFVSLVVFGGVYTTLSEDESILGLVLGSVKYFISYWFVVSWIVLITVIAYFVEMILWAFWSKDDEIHKGAKQDFLWVGVFMLLLMISTFLFR